MKKEYFVVVHLPDFDKSGSYISKHKTFDNACKALAKLIKKHKYCEDFYGIRKDVGYLWNIVT